MPLQKQILCKIIYFFQSKGRNIYIYIIRVLCCTSESVKYWFEEYGLTIIIIIWTHFHSLETWKDMGRTVNPFWISFRQEEKIFYITELSVLSESWIGLASLIFSALSLTFHCFFFNLMLFVHNFISDLNKNQTLKWKKY